MNYSRKMYNYLRRCLNIAAKNHKQFLIYSNHDNVATSEITCYTNNHFWHNITCKRFYSQPVVNNISNDIVNMQNDDKQQKLDEYLSNLENKKIFQILELEIDVLRHNAERVPNNINPKEWLLLLEMESRSQRKKYLNYLWSIEKSNENRKLKKEQKKADWLIKKAEIEIEEETDEIKYSLAHNSLFLRIYKATMNHHYTNNLMQAIMFEPKVIFDCSYDNDMNYADNHNCAKQLTFAFASNRMHINPMCLYFCNLNKGLLMEHLQRNIPNILDDSFPAYITSQSYLDLFPKEQLVYLTPHCQTDLLNYNPEMIYIIGAMVDKSNPKPLSLAKAKKEGLRMAKIPIDKYLEWGSGSTKNLTLNQVLNILLDLKHTRNWKEALQHVPTRKLKKARDNQLQYKIQRSAFISEEAKTEKPFKQIDFTFANRKNR